MDESATSDAHMLYGGDPRETTRPGSLYAASPTVEDDSPPAMPLETTDVQSRPQQSHLMSWAMLSRPPAILLGIAPVILTLALLWAHGASLSLIPALCAVVAVALALAGGNMLDEHLELARSAGQSWLREPGGGYYAGNVLENSGIPPLAALRVSLALLALGALVGIPVVLAGGLPLIVLGVVAIVCSFLYSATRFALKRLPLGELVLMLALGPGLVAATVVSQHGRLQPELLLVGVALGLLVVALVEAAHLRDLDVDRREGRRTLAVVLGERPTRAMYAICILGAYLIVVATALVKGAAHGMVAVLLALPLCLTALTGVVRASSTNVRHRGVVETLRAYVAFVAWLVVGVVVWRAVEILWPLIASVIGV